jgi:hypothetical protein
MTTQYTTILKLALPVQGELSGTWGDTVNDNITQMVEQAIAGKATINSWTANAHTLTTADGTTSESRCAILELTDTGTALTGAGTVTCPTNTKLYIVDNNTAQIITVKTSGGTGVAVPVGKTMLVYCDGTNVVEGVTHANSLSLGTSTVTADKILDEDNMSSDSATALSTQQSIKAYVDSQVGTVDTLAEILANGNTTGGTDLAVSAGDDITFTDTSKAIFGDGSDLQIYHDASHSFIKDAGTGHLKIQATNLKLQDVDGNNYIDCIDGGYVRLMHNTATKLETTATGIDVTGVITTDGMTTSADINFGDDDKAIFGDGSDLQIYHDGSNSIIKENAAGNLLVQGATIRLQTGNGAKDYLVASPSAEITLYYDNSAKLATTNTGIDVTGTVTADGLTVDGTDTEATNSQLLKVRNSTTGEAVTIGLYAKADNGGDGNTGSITFDAGANGAASTSSLRFSADHQTDLNPALKIDGNRDISFYEDTGTTPKFFWDSSAESLGIGTTSPDANIHIVGGGGASGSSVNVAANEFFVDNNGDSGMTIGSSTTGTGYYAFADSDVALRSGIFYDHSSDAMGFRVASNERMRIDSAGNVGIGTSSPQQVLQISQGANATSTTLRIENTDTTIDAAQTANAIEFYTNDSSTGGTGVTGKISHVAINAGSTYGLAFSSYNGSSLSERMRIDEDGNVGIGTTSPSSLQAGAENLVVGSGSGDEGMTIYSGNASRGNIYFADGTTSSDLYRGQINYFHDSDYLRFVTAASEAMRIDSSGNTHIGGTTSISTAVSGDNVAPKLIVEGTTATSIAILRQDTSITSGDSLGSLGFYGTDTTSNTPTPLAAVQALASGTHLAGDNPTDLRFMVTADGSETITEAARFAQSGELRTTTSIMVGRTANRATQAAGITDATIVLAGNSNISGADEEIGKVAFYNQDASAFGHNLAATIKAVTAGSTGADARLVFSTKRGAAEGAEALESMRLDENGNLLVGKTSTGAATAGIELNGANDLLRIARDGGVLQELNRIGSAGTENGDLIDFRVNNASVGSIGTSGGSAYIGGYQNAGLYFNGTSDVRPWNTSTQANLDNSVDLGNSSARFKDLYLSNGVNLGATSALTETSGGDTQLTNTNTGADVFLVSGRRIRFNTAGTESARIDASGNLLVGTTGTPDGTSVYGAGFINTGSSGLVQWLSGTSTTSAVSVARFYNPNGNVGSIQLSGSATSYVTSSDQRLKENIVDAPSASDDIDAIQVRSFDWKADGSHQDYGMVAQELLEVAPEAVSAPEDPEEMMGVDYSKLVPMMLKEIQSLRARVAQLES